MVRMFGWLSAETAFASWMKRRTRSPGCSPTTSGGRIFSATLRSSLVDDHARGAEVVGYQPMQVVRGFGRYQQLPVAIAILFVWTRGWSIGRIFTQQLAVDSVDLPFFLTRSDLAPHTMAIRVIRVTTYLPRIVGRRRHPVLGVIGATANTRIRIHDQIPGVVVTHRTRLTYRHAEPVRGRIYRKLLEVDACAPRARVDSAIAPAIVGKHLRVVLRALACLSPVILGRRLDPVERVVGVIV